MSQSSTAPASVLADAAFGADPGCWPLPTAHDPDERWLRAVAAGGQGHYALARAELAEVRRSVRPGPLVSLAHSTEGSLLRQLGGHACARSWDGRALLIAGDDRESRVDALVGLAADALGVRRFAQSAAMLSSARTVLGDAPSPPDRLEIRVEWVSAELAMATGCGEDALRHARRAVELSAAAVSVRHRTKSDVVLAAALCCAGRLPEAREVADRLLETTERLGLVPLRWAVASLLAGIGSDTHSGPQIRTIRDAAADLITHRGGTWCDG